MLLCFATGVSALIGCFAAPKTEDVLTAEEEKSAKGVGGMELGTGAKQATYAPSERNTEGHKSGQESFLPCWLIGLFCCAILSVKATR